MLVGATGFYAAKIDKVGEAYDAPTELTATT